MRNLNVDDDDITFMTATWGDLLTSHLITKPNFAPPRHFSPAHCVCHAIREQFVRAYRHLCVMSWDRLVTGTQNGDAFAECVVSSARIHSKWPTIDVVAVVWHLHAFTRFVSCIHLNGCASVCWAVIAEAMLFVMQYTKVQNKRTTWRGNLWINH